MLYDITETNKGALKLRPVKRTSLRNAGWKEKDLECYMAVNLPVLLQEEGLMPIFQEREFQYEPDILALDQEGKLFIFELKRWRSQEKDLLQVMKYGQKYGRYDYHDLQGLFVKYRRKQNADDPERELREVHAEHFGLDDDGRDTHIPEEQFNCEQRFVVVTAGIDMKSVEAINYWNTMGLPIEAKVFRVYQVGDRFLFEFDPYCPPEAAHYYQAETNNYIVNTNKSWDADAYEYMIAQQRAAAYGDRKASVDSIQKGDRVFLYHTGLGIIAAGTATDSFKEKDDPEEHYVPCSFDIVVDPGIELERKKAVSAREINQAMGTGHRFRQTVFSISDEMAEEISRRLKEKQQPEQ